MIDYDHKARMLASDVCNILVVGRTGVGKSSLINYLYGKMVARVDIGMPVTSRDDIESYQTLFDGVVVRFFDSWGIECDKTDDWQDRIRKIVGNNGSAGTDGVCWFHTIVYCISAGNDRVEPSDLPLMRHFREEGYSVVVALTQCDLASDDHIKCLEQEIPTGFRVVRLSSGGEDRYGKTDPFGKEDLLAAIVEECIQNLPVRVRHALTFVVKSWEEDMKGELRWKDVGRFSNGDIEEWIKTEAHSAGDMVAKCYETFIKKELKALAAWAPHLAGRVPQCEMLVKDGVSSELTAWDYLGMAALAVPFAIFATVYFIAKGVESERNRLSSMIESATQQLLKYVNKISSDFAEKLGVPDTPLVTSSEDSTENAWIWKCGECGTLYRGLTAPSNCPTCNATSDKFDWQP